MKMKSSVFFAIMVMCGSAFIVSAINGGQIIEPEMQPQYCWMVGVWCSNTTLADSRLECSGAIVTSTRVVTSYDCYDKIKNCKTKWIRAGVTSMADKGIDRNVTKIEKIKRKGANQDMGLALLNWKDALPEDSTFCAVYVADKDDMKHKNGTLEVSGFADPKLSDDIAHLHLRMATMPIFDYEECNQLLFDYQYQQTCVSVDLFCFSGKEACKFIDDSDTGAPMVYRYADNKALLIGIATRKFADRDTIVPKMEFATRVGVYQYEILY